ncbi:hypothetical protein [Paraliobacillus ryukyuensis]|uniref:hypothetical protein n=1 Tax=Paraliobacillus ryukyuensis TaxID=200904 RepID=UPI0009A7CA6D|nr:hypothetical protein [Paraliobacillus ryukyuensis]
MNKLNRFLPEDQDRAEELIIIAENMIERLKYAFEHNCYRDTSDLAKKIAAKSDELARSKEKKSRNDELRKIVLGHHQMDPQALVNEQKRRYRI